MAIQWGAWEYSGGNGMRVGVEVTTSTVTTSSTTVTFTFKVYTQNQYWYSDSQTLTYTGTASGGSPDTFTNDESSTATLRATETYVYTYSTYGTSPGTRTFSATISGAYNGVTPTGSVTVTIPARPYAVPTAPSALTATRNSDTQVTLGWTRNVTTQKPYTSQTIQRRVWTGSAWGAFEVLATVSATATTYVDSTTTANHVYDYGIRSNNSVGSSSYTAAAAYVFMSPTAPSSVSASIAGGGTSIDVSWVPTNYLTTSVTFTVQRSVAGGAYADVTTGVAYNLTAWTDPSPGVGSNKYRVKAVQATGPLDSAWTESNTVTTAVAPLAPTQLSPNGAAADATGTIPLTWSHNPDTDGAPQTHFKIRFSSDGGSTWPITVADTASALEGYGLPADTLTNGVDYVWQVATEGVVSVGYGPWSASATLSAVAAPSVSIDSGYPPATVSSLPIEIRWTYNQDQSSPQVAWSVQLLNDSWTVLHQEISGTGTASSASFTYPVVDGVTYIVAVNVQSADGLWSGWTWQGITIDLLPPAEVVLVGTYQECTGTMLLSLTPGVEEAGVSVPVVSATIERGLDDGTWVVLASDVTLPADILDMTPTTSGPNVYRVTGVSASPSYLVNAPVTVNGTDGSVGHGLWTFLSYGDGFSKVLRMRAEVSSSAISSRTAKAEPLLGRRLPLALLGESRSRVLSVSGILRWDETCVDPDDCTYDSPRADWETAAWESEIVCLRDHTGRRVFGLMGDLSAVDGPAPGMASVSFGVTQTDYTELPGVVAT